MKILGGILIWVGFLLIYGTAGQSDFETFQAMKGVDIIPTPLTKTIATVAVGIFLFLGGIKALLWEKISEKSYR